MKISKLDELYVEELRDLCSAEQQIIAGLPETIKAVQNTDFKNALSSHLEQTHNHKKRLEEIFDSLEVSSEGNTCEATEGLIEEVKEIISEIEPGTLRDIAIAGAAQRIEFYEQAAYQSAIRLAEALDRPEHADSLRQTLSEEEAAGEKVSYIGDHLCWGKQATPTAVTNQYAGE